MPGRRSTHRALRTSGKHLLHGWRQTKPPGPPPCREEVDAISEVRRLCDLLYADDALRKKVEEQLKPIEEAVERGSLMDLARPKRTQSWEKYIHHGTRK